MDKHNWMLIGCLMLLSIVVGCGHAETTHSPAPPIPGWEKFEGGDVELWLPHSYEGGDLRGENLDVIVEEIRTLGPDFEREAQAIEKKRSGFVIYAVDSAVGDSGAMTNMNVFTERVPSAVTMNTYLNIVAKKLPRQYRVLEREIVPLNHYEAGRMVVEIKIQGAHVKSLMYAIKSGSTVWTLNYGTTAEEFDQRLPIFEQGAQTFTVRTQQGLWGKLREKIWAKLLGGGVRP